MLADIIESVPLFAMKHFSMRIHVHNRGTCAFGCRLVLGHVVTMHQSPCRSQPRLFIPLLLMFLLLGVFGITGIALFKIRKFAPWTVEWNVPQTVVRNSAVRSNQLLAVGRRHTMIFKEHPEFQNLNHEFDHFWDDNLPPNLGFLLLFNETENKNAWVGVSMFHQLHCLGMIRGALQGAMRELEELVEIHGGAHEHNNESHHHHTPLQRRKDVHGDHHDKNHFLHCFDYLRQVRWLITGVTLFFN